MLPGREIIFKSGKVVECQVKVIMNFIKNDAEIKVANMKENHSSGIHNI